MNNFKTKLRSLPTELFKEVEKLLIEHGMNDIEVTGIDISSTQELAEEDCAAEGKKLKCKKRADGTIKCWCVKRD
ncbi:hypothetical protein [Flavivirga spongiicola]|uniref:Uncharacterized protein n=1 Tax=Flavivirga spongiicola TaxID=421621 RepID=A0ABU7XYS0_9FLAO|nr:hypothetical protein [Flavivirga sp. MEBiC05379]MDO5980598.1 hypothetical protein [Flavivirga sp. MEBiC05379]